MGTLNIKEEEQMQFVELRDIRLSYRQLGEGQPVVLVHGLAEDLTSWDEVVELLGRDVNLNVISFRGHGETSAGSGDGTVEQLADDLLEFVSKVTGPAVCVGFSLGGVIVLEAALRNPDLVKKAVVIGTSSKVGKVAANFFGERINQAQNDFSNFLEEIKKDTDGQIYKRREKLEEISRKRIKAVADGAGYINAAKAMLKLAEEPMTERLKEIKVPIHIIQGEKDIFCPQKAADILMDAMPTADFSVIEDAGHLISVDQPEKLAKEISKSL